MKKTHAKLFTAVILIAAMALSVAGCGEQQAQADAIDPAYVAQLEQECVELRNQLATLKAQIGDLEQTVVLKSHALKAVPNEDSSGASIEITAVPMRYQEGQKALFQVALNGKDVTAVEGNWDGTAYTASVGLQAADGYSYECILTQPDGSKSNVVLSSPEAPLYESCVYLQASLSAYCNMIVDSSDVDGDTLVLNAGYVQVQLPRIGSRSLEYKSSALVMKIGNQELQRLPLEIPEGEAEGSREMALQDVRFDIPADLEDQQMDLWLEVTLSDDQVLTYNGCSWNFEDGELILSAG